MQSYEKLEYAWSEWTEQDVYCVAVSSGTAGLHLAIETLAQSNGLYRKQSWGLPDFTMYSCLRAIELANMRPKLLAVNTYGVIEWTNEAKESVKNVIGLMPVHIYGNYCSIPSDYEGLIVEDLSEAHGIPPDERSTAAVWSCYKNKIIGGEEGGIIAFRSKEEADLAKQLRNLGHSSDHDFSHIPGGHNYRLSNVHADLILHSLKNYDTNIDKRYQVREFYDKYLYFNYKKEKHTIPWVYDIVDPRFDIVKMCKDLHGLGVRRLFKPLSSQPGKGHLHIYPQNQTAKFLYENGFYLPINPKMTEQDVKDICQKVEQYRTK